MHYSWEKPRLLGNLVQDMLSARTGRPNVIWIIFSLAVILVAYGSATYYRQEPKNLTKRASNKYAANCKCLSGRKILE